SGDIDRTADTAVRLFGGTGVQHQRRPHLHLVATGQQMLSHLFPVDKRSVGTIQVGDSVIAMRTTDLGVMARDLGIVNVDGARLVASEPEDGLLQLITRALVVSSNDKQRRHDYGSRAARCWNPSGIRLLRTGDQVASDTESCWDELSRHLAVEGDWSHPYDYQGLRTGFLRFYELMEQSDRAW